MAHPHKPKQFFSEIDYLQDSEHMTQEDIKKQITLSQNRAPFRQNYFNVQKEMKSQKDTMDHVVQLQLQSKISKESNENVPNPKIQIYDEQLTEFNEFRKYDKVLIQSYSKARKESNFNIKDVQMMEKVQNHNQLIKPEKIQGKKLSLQLSGESDFLIGETDSIMLNSQPQQEDSITQNLFIQRKSPESRHKICRNIDETNFRAKSQKKVTFIGNQSMRVSQDGNGNKIKGETQNEIQEDASVTSILQYPMTNRMKVKVQQSSRKIISQDENYCLFRIVSFKKSDKHLMCRSVEIKNSTTQEKQLKHYLLCREHQHANIVRVHSFERVVRDNKNFLEVKMDYYPKNLEEYVLENKKIQKKASIERKIILFQILRALNYIHSRGICHQDLNPHSIMIADQLEVAITNFASPKESSSSLSQDNFYQCNFFIRPPQVILQPLKKFQAGGDIWAFGCIIVYMLKGEMPFFKVSDAEMMIQMMKVLGLPPKQYLESLHFRDFKRFLFPKISRKSFESVFRCQDQQLLSMLKKIFVYRAQERPSAGSLMGSSYFDELRDEVLFKNLMKSYDISNIFQFKEDELTMDLREIVIPQWFD